MSDTSVTEKKENKINYIWTIENFKSVSKFNFNKKIISPTYSNFGFDWNAELENIKTIGPPFNSSNPYYWMFYLKLKKMNAGNIFEGHVQIKFSPNSIGAPPAYARTFNPRFQQNYVGVFVRINLDDINTFCNGNTFKIEMELTLFQVVTKHINEDSKIPKLTCAQ